MEIVSLSTVVEVDEDNVHMLLMDLSLFSMALLEEILPGTPRDEILNALVEDAKSIVDDMEPSALNDLLLMFVTDDTDESDVVIERYNEWFSAQSSNSDVIRYGEALRELLIDELPLDDENFKYLGCVIKQDNLEACTLYYTLDDSDEENEENEDEDGGGSLDDEE